MIMRCLKSKYVVAFAGLVAIGLTIAAGCVAPKTAPPTAAAPGTLGPSPDDARIAYQTAQFMENLQYSQQPLDKAMSKKIFDGYLETLDPRRENFLQSDIDEFSHYRTNLDTLIIGSHGRSNLTPAFAIFNRFLERLKQHTAYVDKLLKRDHFQFDTDEQFTLDRSKAPYPKDLDQAKALWRRELRYEYLQEKLNREFSPTNGGTVLHLSKSADADIAKELERNYNWMLHTFTNWDSQNVLTAYLNALTHAYDPHSDYFSQQGAQNFSIEMSLSLFGIGAQLSEDFGYCTIDSLIPGGPAAKSGQIHAKDRIIAVAQSNQPPVNVVGMDLSKVVEMIRGPKGTQVRLTVEQKGDPSSRHVVALTRERIKLEDQEAKADLIEMPDDSGGTNRIGVIDVPSFYAPIGTSAHNFISVDVAKLIKKLEAEKVAGIILDMRNNPGGSLEEAIRFTGLFIKKGPVVLVRNSLGRVEEDTTSDPATYYSGPLVVLVNRYSASAAEIAAAALQDYGRAVIVGDTSTHGKGTVQTLTKLGDFIWPATPDATNNPGELKITIRKFYRVTGASTQLKGVKPDIVLPDVLNYSKNIGESALENALPWDSIRGVAFHKFGLVQPYLAELRERSETRTATNVEFNFIRQDIANFKKIQAQKTFTLNEQDALKQRKEETAEKTARDKELAKIGLPRETTYELTVQNAGKPGLPSPLVQTNSPADMSNGQLDAAARLNETEHILEDYISLLSRSPVVAAKQ